MRLDAMIFAMPSLLGPVSISPTISASWSSATEIGVLFSRCYSFVNWFFQAESDLISPFGAGTTAVIDIVNISIANAS